jgi:hypothetical protein
MDGFLGKKLIKEAKSYMADPAAAEARVALTD